MDAPAILRRRLRSRLPVAPVNGRRTDAAGRRRVLLVLALALAGAGVFRSPAGLLLGALGWKLGALASGRVESQSGEEIRRTLPDALDLLGVCTLGGMGLDPALRVVTQATPGRLGDAFGSALRALEAGIPRDRVYRLLEHECPIEEVSSFVAALRRAERYGTPVAAAISAHATELRSRRAAQIRERAAGAPVRMLFPLTLCFLPAFVLLAIGPALLVALRAFRAR